MNLTTFEKPITRAVVTVKELRAILVQFEENAIVCLAHDAEGNGYGRLDVAVSEGFYDAVEDEFAPREEFEEDGEAGAIVFPPAICLYPVD